ncbi:N-acetylmuramoyl-L-alanine amidase [Rhodoferax sp. BLA1]|uniref:N-acetylmuramoyl-L-alanine amidase n=1 Tax=Rhodoferax sp. BLA1 TaxID=2576062 RepID=UPI0015D35181|nr:N-acetylmuramoyl-L-alanine amidase [Rhodoferax sp. BLA1]
MRLIDLLVIHCSATPSGRPLTRGLPGQPGFKNCVQIIDEWHSARGFHRAFQARRAQNPELSAIGYHFVIDLDGTIHSGRAVAEVGAHAQGHNANSIGICMIGGTERDGKYTTAQWRALAYVVRELTDTYAIQLKLPTRNGDTVSGGVCGHRDLSPDANGDGQVTAVEWLKTCPGFDVGAWLSTNLAPAAKNVLGGAV